MSQKLILLWGNAYIGKSVEYANTHHSAVLVDFTELIRGYPDSSFRQLLNAHVVAPLNKGRDVILECCSEAVAKRKSVVNLIRQRVSGTEITCHVLQPRFGGSQWQWLVENLLAECAMGLHTACKHSAGWRGIQQRMLSCNSSEAVASSEGFAIEERSLDIKIQTFWKFDVPALLIQWESLLKVTPTESRESIGQRVIGAKKDEKQIVAGADNAVEEWCRVNPCGRVIIVWDGTEKTKDSDAPIKEVLLYLAAKVVDQPVYLLHVSQPARSPEFSRPPLPGLLSYLHRLHHIHLTAPGTMYWYHTASHMTMAEKAGIRHIKASRVYSNPKLATTTAGTTNPPFPAMLAAISYVPPQSNWCATRDQSSPGTSAANTSAALGSDVSQSTLCPGVTSVMEEDSFVKVHDLEGRVMYLARRSTDSLHKHMNLLLSRVRRIDDDGDRRIYTATAPSVKHIATRRPKVTSQEGQALPYWMTFKGPKKLKDYVRPLLHRRSSASSSAVVYCMSGEELKQTATFLLSQLSNSSTANDSNDAELNTEQNTQYKDENIKKNTSRSQDDNFHVGAPPSTDKEAPIVTVLDDLLDFRPTATSSQVHKTESAATGKDADKTMGSRDKSVRADNVTHSTSGPDKANGSSDMSVTSVPDSFVRGSSSTLSSPHSFKSPTSTVPRTKSSSGGSGVSDKSRTSVPDSLVPVSPSSSNSFKATVSPGSGKSFTSVADSLVAGSSSSSTHDIPQNPQTSDNRVANERTLLIDGRSTTLAPENDSSKHSIPQGRELTGKTINSSSSNVISVPDSLVKSMSTRSNSKRSTSGSGEVKSIPDSLVKSSSSSSKSPGVSPHQQHSRSTSAEGSGNTSVRSVPDSLVKNSSSTSPGGVRRNSDLTSIPDSFVKGSTSSKSPHVSSNEQNNAAPMGSSGSGAVKSIPDSFVQASVSSAEAEIGAKKEWSAEAQIGAKKEGEHSSHEPPVTIVLETPPLEGSDGAFLDDLI